MLHCTIAALILYAQIATTSDTVCSMATLAPRFVAQESQRNFHQRRTLNETGCYRAGA